MGVGRKIYDGVNRKIQNFLLRGGMCMLSFLIKERKCLYRNIPVIKFCYTSENQESGEKEGERAERRKIRDSDKKIRKKKREDGLRIMCIFFVKLKYSIDPYENINMSITKKKCELYS